MKSEKPIRDTFLFKIEWWEIIREQPDDICLEIMDAIMGYAFYGVINELSPIAKIAFQFIKQDIDKQPRGNKGKEHWNWKGGITPENQRIRNSSKTREWRLAVLKRDNYTCCHCGKRGGILNVHHIKPFSIYPESRFDIDNGLTLCKKCHVELHKKEREWVGKVL